MGLRRKSAAPERSKPAKTEDQNYYCRLTVELCMRCYACKRLIGICPNRIKLCPSVVQTGLAEEEQEEGMQTYGQWTGKVGGVRYSRQFFSSLLSKQSGSPSHCQPPGTHFPSPHMKFPGMLHSVVKLLPGSSWLSDR